jgi:hypothetical protein
LKARPNSISRTRPPRRPRRRACVDSSIGVFQPWPEDVEGTAGGLSAAAPAAAGRHARAAVEQIIKHHVLDPEAGGVACKELEMFASVALELRVVGDEQEGGEHLAWCKSE